ncbi:hypothetical protein AAHE18_03G365900 [Arachis hypogaea]
MENLTGDEDKHIKIITRKNGAVLIIVLDIKCSPVEPIFVSAADLEAGQSSTITRTYAGQFITEGFLKLNIKKWLRSLITHSKSKP